MKQIRSKIPMTEYITYTALLVAIQVVMGRLQLALPTKQFNFGFLPVAIAGHFLGAPSAMFVGALGDFFGANLFPVGPYFVGFTVTHTLVGLIYGLLLYRQKAGWLRVAAASLLASACYLFLNSYWLTFILPDGYWILVGTRVVLTCLIDVPVSCVVIHFMMKSINWANRPVFQAHLTRETEQKPIEKEIPHEKEM